MGELNVQFQGICVNFQQTSNPVLPVAHRIVLVNASRITAPLAGKTIPPHFASLQSPPPLPLPGLAVPLCGCTVRVSNALTTPNSYDPSFSTLPNLTDLMLSGLPEPEVLGPPSLPVLVGENPFLAACYFDVASGGTFSVSSTSLGSAGTLLTVATADDPVLELIPFRLSPFPPPEIASFQFPSGATVTIQNVASPKGESEDSEFHFYLSYLTAAKFPDHPVVPGEPPGVPLGGNKFFVGPGCSDSNYP